MKHEFFWIGATYAVIDSGTGVSVTNSLEAVQEALKADFAAMPKKNPLAEFPINWWYKNSEGRWVRVQTYDLATRWADDWIAKDLDELAAKAA